MVLLEITNLKSGETHEIPPEGAVLGREGAKAEIQIRDPGVSKKHARVYEKGGVWYLQDLGSSNGTFMQGKRLTGPVVLTESTVFGMSRHKFKVTRIGGQDAGGSLDDDEPLFGDDLAPPEPAPRDRSASAPRPPLPPQPPSYPPEAPPPLAEPSYGAQTAPPQFGAGGSAYAAGDDEIEARGVGYFFLAVPKAVAYYLAAVPLLALNPFGSVRKGIEEQKQAPMGPMELIAYALPAQIFGAVLISWAMFVGALIGGSFQLMLLFPIVPLVVAVVGSVITGFIWHPVTTFVIRLLKGSSDARSRSNYFLAFQTAFVLTRLPAALAVLLALANLPFINIIPPLLSLAATLVMLLVAYRWLVYFNVLRAVQIVVLVLGALAGLSGAYGVVSAVIDSVKQVTSGSSGDAAGDLAELSEKMLAIQADADLSDAEKAAKLQELAAERASLEAAAAQALLEDQGDPADDAEDPEDDKPADERPDDKKPADKKPDEKKPADKKPDDKKPADKKPIAASSDKLPPAPSDFSYPQFRDRRDKMEDALTKDVTLLSRVRGTLEAYRSYHAKKHDIDQRFASDTAANPGKRVVNERLAEDELYRRAWRDVKKFWDAVDNYK